MIQVSTSSIAYVSTDWFGHLRKFPYRFTKTDIVLLYLELKEYLDCKRFGMIYFGFKGDLNYKVMFRKSKSFYLHEICDMLKCLCGSDSIYFLVNFEYMPDYGCSIIKNVSIKK